MNFLHSCSGTARSLRQYAAKGRQSRIDSVKTGARWSEVTDGVDKALLDLRPLNGYGETNR